MNKSYFGELKNDLALLRKIRESIDHIRSIKEETCNNLNEMDDEFDECDDLEDQVSSLESIVDDLDSAIDELEIVFDCD